MLTLASLRMRRTGLSATDMARLSGENPYGGPIDVYMEKTSEAPVQVTPPTGKALTGHLMEAAIAKRYVHDATPEGRRLYIVQTAKTYRHPEVPWAMATPDRFIFNLGKDEPAYPFRPLLPSGAHWALECKLVGTRVAHHWDLSETSIKLAEDRIPTYVYVQVQWQMFVCGLTRVDVAAIAYGTQFACFQVPRNDDYINLLRQMGLKFWTEHVLTKQPPPPDGSKGYAWYLEQAYRNARADRIQAPDGTQDVLNQYVAAKQAEQAANKEKTRLLQVLNVMLGDHQEMIAPSGLVRRVEQKGKVNWKALAAAMDIPEDVVDSYRGEPTRSLRVRTEEGDDDE